MNSLASEISYRFIKHYGLEKSRNLFVPDRLKNTKVDPEEPDEVLQQLIQVGLRLNLLYLKKQVSLSHFDDLITKSWYPVLFFLKMDKGLFPVMIFDEKKQLKLLIFDKRKTEELRLSSIADLPGDFLTEKNEKGEEQIQIITCFPNEEPFNDEELDRDLPENRFRIISKFFKVLATEKKEIFYIFLYSSFAGLISLTLPLGVQSLIGFVSSGQVVTSAVVLIIFIIVGILMNGIVTIMQLEITEFIQQRLFARAAFSYAFRIPRLKFEALLKYYPPELINRFFDTLTLQKGLSTVLIDFSAAILQTIFGILLLSFYHPLFLVLGVFLLVVLGIILRISGPKGLKTALKESAFKYFVANWLEETGRALSTFKLAGNTTFAIEKTDHFVSNYIKARDDHFKVLKVQYYSFVFFKTIITALLLIFGSILLVERQINLGQFIASEIVIILIMNSVEKIILKLDSVYDILVSVEKLTDIIRLPVENNGIIDLPIENDRGLSIRMDDVSYHFPESARPSLHNVSFEVEESERVCIAGPNGAGKSTLINIMLGLFESYNGIISYNGISLKDLNKPALRNHIGDFITYEALFDGTIIENITVGRTDISYSDLIWAIEAAGLKNYIDHQEEGLSTRLIGGSSRVSSSIARKIIIARNLLLKPSLLILDDFLLGIDRKEKKRILDIVLNEKYNWTVILISNDPMVMKSCNKLVIMDQGTVINTGTYDDLKDSDKTLNMLIQNYI